MSACRVQTRLGEFELTAGFHSWLNMLHSVVQTFSTALSFCGSLRYDFSRDCEVRKLPIAVGVKK